VRYLLVLLLVGCGNPPLGLKGENAQWYGVSENQNSPLGCDLDESGMPKVTIVTTKEITKRCGNEGFFDAFAWGCIEYIDGKATAIATNNIQTIRHEQAHCLLGSGHVARPISYSAKSPFTDHWNPRYQE